MPLRLRLRRKVQSRRVSLDQHHFQVISVTSRTLAFPKSTWTRVIFIANLWSRPTYFGDPRMGSSSIVRVSAAARPGCPSMSLVKDRQYGVPKLHKGNSRRQGRSAGTCFDHRRLANYATTPNNR